MSRIGTKLSVRMFAVFVLVGGLVGGAYLTLHRPGQQPTEVAQQQVVGQPIDPIEEQQAQRQATDGYRQQKMRDEASRSATRDAQQKAAAGGEHAAAVAGDADAAKKAEQQKKTSSGGSSSGSSSGSAGPVPSSCKEYSGNRATGCTLLLQAGFGLDQMSCLDSLWTKESGWNVHASNPSGAYGIPQALPGDKMAEYGSDWQDNPVPQIKWGLSYIKGKYSTPCGAWSHSQSTGWY